MKLYLLKRYLIKKVILILIKNENEQVNFY